MEILSLVLIGGAAGVMAGLLGIGGGAIIVPVLALLFERQGARPEVIMHSAIGTSLATIVFTALSSIRAHQKRGAVRWDIFRRLTPGIVVGALMGAAIADVLSGTTLRYMFGVFLLVLAVHMAFGHTKAHAHRPLPGNPGMFAAGTIIGAISSLFGIGGAALQVPFMTWCSVPVRHAVATASAVGLPIALSGALGYVAAGLNETGLPAGSVGFVVLPAFGGIVIASMLAAPLGARIAHRIPERTLRHIFSLFLLVLGARMLLG